MNDTRTRDDLVAEALDSIAKSSLSEADKSLWQKQFQTFSYNTVAFFLNTLHDDPSLLPDITENMKKKIDAGIDVAKIQAVVDEEEKILRDALAQ